MTQVRLLKGKHLHVNLIRVGVENFTWADEQKLDWAVCKLREIYAQENARLGVGRVDRCDIAEAQAQTLGIFNSVIVDNEQMGGLTDAFDGPPGPSTPSSSSTSRRASSEDRTSTATATSRMMFCS